MSAQPIPQGYHSVTPYLMVRGAQQEIDFLKQAFGATEKECLKNPDGSIMHAELQIGDSIIMLGEPHTADCPATSASFYLYVKDVDATYQRAVKAGGQSVMEVTDMFYGDRTGAVNDPAGNRWSVATHKEDVMGDELKRRAQTFMAQQQEQHKKAA